MLDHYARGLLALSRGRPRSVVWRGQPGFATIRDCASPQRRWRAPRPDRRWPARSGTGPPPEPPGAVPVAVPTSTEQTTAMHDGLEAAW